MIFISLLRHTPHHALADVDFGNQILGRDYFQLWDRARVRATYSTPRYYDGVYDPDSFHFHSLNYAVEVAADARAAGAALHEQTPATAVDLLSDGRKRVSTLAGHTVTADHVVLCGSAYLPSLGGKVGGGAAARVRRAVLPGEHSSAAQSRPGHDDPADRSKGAPTGLL